MAKTENNSVKDIDGNTYNLVQIGTQIWTTENLTVSKYRNGDAIPQVQDAAKWDALKTGAWCYYENNPKYGAIYGKLYNWYAVNDPRGLAPDGFHIPSENEWTILIKFLGGKKVAGGTMKEKGTKHWLSTNKDITNAVGFKGLPAGIRHCSGPFFSIGDAANFWSSTLADRRDAWYHYLQKVDNCAGREYEDVTSGFSVRCIKD